MSAAEHGVAGDGRGQRLLWLDAARTVSLLGMILFHFARDLEMFGVLSHGTTLIGAWPAFARLVAGSFLVIAGISFVLAHADGFRVRAWSRRVAAILGAAGLVSGATFIVFPANFIYFGILHAIGFASVAGLAFLRAPFWLTGASALVVLAIGNMPVDPPFQGPWLVWTGLSSTLRPSLDFVPVFPWLAPFLFGMAAAQCFPPARGGAPTALSHLARILTWPGRHSLVIYLVHQPVLLGLIWLAVALLP